MDEQYLEWKDKKSAPFRERWIQALAKHEQMVKRYYAIFEKYLTLETTHDQLVNARHDRERASKEVNLAYSDYRGALLLLTVEQYQKEKDAKE